jgi:protein-tyrosine phosphatase
MRRRQLGKVLLLCFGNICRSPLAAALAAKKFPDVSFSSAGFHSETGRHSPDFVLSAAERLGVDLTEHRSKCVDAKMIDGADLILIMDTRNRELLIESFPDAIEKTLFLGMFLLEPQWEMEDPYADPDSMEKVSSEISCAVERLGKLWR